MNKGKKNRQVLRALADMWTPQTSLPTPSTFSFLLSCFMFPSTLPSMPHYQYEAISSHLQLSVHFILTKPNCSLICMTSHHAAAAGTSCNVKVMGSKEYVNVSSPPPSSAKDSLFSADTELELGLGLSLGGGKNKAGKTRPSSAFVGRILTAKDFPTAMVSSAGHPTASSLFSNRANPPVGAVSGTKRAADSVPQEGGSPTSASHVVGWPPIRTHRMNTLINQAKSQRAEEDKGSSETNNFKDHVSITKTNKSDVKGKLHLGFVKVNMDGVQIGRKVDLNAHTSYESLAHTIEEMFLRSTHTRAANQLGGEKEASTRASKLLDGSSEFVLTYEDKEGDWMLVGDVPWRMFVSSVKRLRIMRTSEANGLAPKVQDKSKQERSRPI